MHDVACSPPRSSPFLDELNPKPGGQHATILVVWKGVLHVSYPDLHLVPNMFNGVHVFICEFRSVQSVTSIACCARKSVVLHAVWGKALSKNVRRPGKHTIADKRDVTFVVESSLVPTMVDGTHTTTEQQQLPFME